jgi:benzodiazapine receptor
MNRSRSWLGLLGWLALSYAAAGLGALASAQAGSFYLQLARPAWAPPAGVFGPVWTVLYGLMGIAAWWVWRSGSERRRLALALFFAQLAVNTLWSWFFFQWRLGGWSFADILLLDVLVVATLAAFWRIRRAAGLLLVPYLAWIAFATALTWAVWQANPGLLR